MDNVAKLLSSLDGVEQVIPCESSEDGICEVIIDTTPEIDVRQRLFRLLAERDIPMMGLENVSLTLEDIFTSLTQGKEEK